MGFNFKSLKFFKHSFEDHNWIHNTYFKSMELCCWISSLKTIAYFFVQNTFFIGKLNFINLLTITNYTNLRCIKMRWCVDILCMICPLYSRSPRYLSIILHKQKAKDIPSSWTIPNPTTIPITMFLFDIIQSDRAS